MKNQNFEYYKKFLLKQYIAADVVKYLDFSYKSLYNLPDSYFGVDLILDQNDSISFVILDYKILNDYYVQQINTHQKNNLIDSIIFTTEEKNIINLANNIFVKKIKEKYQKTYFHAIKIEKNNFDMNIELLKKWKETNNRIPSRYSQNKLEKKLAIFIMNCRQKYKNNILAEEHINIVEKIINNMENTKSYKTCKIFNKNINLLKTWLNDNKRLPKKRSNNKLEKKLASFIYKCKNNNKLADEQIKTIKDILGDININIYNEEIFNKNIELLKKWKENNNKSPLTTSKNKIEKKLGWFIHHCKNCYSKNKLADGRKKAIEAILGNDFFINNKAKINKIIFDDNITLLKKWKENNNNKLPSYNLKNKRELKIYRFIHYCKRRYNKNMLADERKNAVEAIYPAILTKKRKFDTI